MQRMTAIVVGAGSSPLQCGISTGLMSEVGQTEKSRQRDGTAGLPSTPDIFDARRHGR
jgi:hypothetical protein